MEREGMIQKEEGREKEELDKMMVVGEVGAMEEGAGELIVVS